MSAAQAKQPGADASPRPALPELQIAPNLQIHKNIDDNEISSFLIGDKMESDEDGKVKLTGAAEVRRIDSVVKGDYIDYQRSTGQVRVRGNGLIMREASIVKGPEIDYNINNETGEI
ncbi:MAG: LPS-assembly protein LptD, partial [Pollutimonas bauzanensis]